MEEYIEEAIDIINKELEVLAEKISANISLNGQYASGKTNKSLKVNKLGLGGELKGRKYFSALETGKKPSYTPIDSLIKWIKAKGLSESPEKDKSFAYAISRTHAASGSKLYRMGGRNDIYSQEINHLIEKLPQLIADKLTLTINKYINAGINK